MQRETDIFATFDVSYYRPKERPNMVRVVEGIEAMGQEEAAYWLGMAMHRVNPRRVLSALRMLLTDPAPRDRMR